MGDRLVAIVLPIDEGMHKLNCRYSLQSGCLGKRNVSCDKLTNGCNGHSDFFMCLDD